MRLAIDGRGRVQMSILVFVNFLRGKARAKVRLVMIYNTFAS